MPRMLVLRHSMHRDTGFIGGQAKLMIDEKDRDEVAQSAEFRITVPPSDQVVVEWKPGFGDSSDSMPPAFSEHLFKYCAPQLMEMVADAKLTDVSRVILSAEI